jgi:glycerophosphoryl diester phosphodiesterase
VNQILHQPWPGGGTGIGVLAHRGRGTSAADNTVEAFAAALEAGADGVELDVRRSAEGAVVVHHDPEVPGVGPLHLVERPALPPWLPTLEQALCACRGAVVDVEVKSSPAEPGYDPAQRLAGQVADIVAGALAGADGPRAAFVSSFWPPILEAVRRRRPELAVGLLVVPGVDPLSALDQAIALGASVLLPVAAHSGAEVVGAAHSRGLWVVPWAVDSDDELVAARRSGVDAVVTDRPGPARLLLGRG